MWAVKVDLMCQNWGSGGPITRRDFIYPTFEEALSYAWDYIQKRFENSSGTSRKESTIFYKEYSKYKDMASENYFTLFKEGNFYGFI